MDAADEADIGLQQVANSTIQWLTSALPLLFFRSYEDSTPNVRNELRSAVRTNMLYRVIDSLAPFQELPQLLDPKLEDLLRPLSEALTCCSQVRLDDTPKPSKGTNPSLAVCKILYTFCRIRGAKVVVRFLSNEAKHLVPVVEILESRLHPSAMLVASEEMHWEEKYVYLLWLSYLVLTPFPFPSSDQKTISGITKQLELPASLHFVSRICSLALSQLSSPSKERDSTVMVLVHLVMRPDMKAPQLMNRLLDLIKQSLGPEVAQVQSESSSAIGHEAIGWLALLAGIFNAADAQCLFPHLKHTVHHSLTMLASSETGVVSAASSAVARKLIVKVLRCSALAALTISSSASASPDAIETADEILEEVIEQLLNCLSDADTPVRHAGSKALSVITLKLDPQMGTEIIEAVISSLDEGVLWNESATDHGTSAPGNLSKSRDLSLVNPLRWQGLMLTLAQLLFRKAPAPEVLPSVISSLIVGLSFEQRTSTGMSVGGPVRDAANFGIWALSRQYTTAELSAIQPSSVQSVTGSVKGMSLLQVLACELVNAACLDPSGNIRRGSSAALQELIGRHPDTITNGINIVQTVDYHAIALRSLAITKVSVAAGALKDTYCTSLLGGLLDWRGIFSIDAESRRWAAKAIGELANYNEALATQVLQVLYRRTCGLQPREVEERHGLLLAAEQVIQVSSQASSGAREKAESQSFKLAIHDFRQLFAGPRQIESKCFTNTALRPFLTSEAVFCLLARLCQLSVQNPALSFIPEPALVSSCIHFIELSASVREQVSLSEIAKAATTLLVPEIISPSDLSVISNQWIQKFLKAMRTGPSQESATIGWLTIFGRLYKRLPSNSQTQVVEVILSATTKEVGVSVRVAALENLECLLCEASDRATQRPSAQTIGQFSSTSSVMTPKVLEAILKCLSDFTTDQRGDVGSLVRVAALRCASRISSSWLQEHTAATWPLLALACGLAVEKLDRVRAAARPCVVAVSRTLSDLYSGHIAEETDDCSSTAHFLALLTLAVSHPDELLVPTLTGLVSAVGTGSESVLRCSREGLELLLATDYDGIQLTLLNGLTSVLVKNINDERLVPQALLTIAFLFETGALKRYETSKDAADVVRHLFVQVQKAHYKSTGIPRLLAAVDIYASLSSFWCVRTSITKKLSSMLGHQFPLVRRRAAESLYCITHNEKILDIDWSNSQLQLKAEIQEIRDAVLS